MDRRAPETPRFVTGVARSGAPPFLRVKESLRKPSPRPGSPTMVGRPMPMQGHRVQEPAHIRDVRTPDEPAHRMAARQGVAQTVATPGSTTHVTDAMDAPADGQTAVARGATAATPRLHAVLPVPPNAPIKGTAALARLFRIRRTGRPRPGVRSAQLRLILKPTPGFHVVHDAGGLRPSRRSYKILDRMAKVSQAGHAPLPPAPVPCART